ncbi:hypothetical protein [Nocardia sp. NPDC005745]|uniref:hypothetical protein n=1 Tax=Nocardia sp. NPDC005745 TaxID=3157061 RepID=UPI0033CE2984
MTGNSIHRIISCLSIAAFAGAIGIGVVVSAPSAAAESRHRVDLTEACKDQYHRQTVYVRHIDQRVAGIGGKATPYGYYCAEWTEQLTVSKDPAYQAQEKEVGDLDVQAYCSKKYPGSRAVGNFDDDRTWDCVS